MNNGLSAECPFTNIYRFLRNLPKPQHIVPTFQELNTQFRFPPDMDLFDRLQHLEKLINQQCQKVKTKYVPKAQKILLYVSVCQQLYTTCFFFFTFLD